jgi:hypothetical protein
MQPSKKTSANSPASPLSLNSNDFARRIIAAAAFLTSID